MKKLVVVMAAMLLIIQGSILFRCTEVCAGSDKIKIVTTIFPEYEWVMEILGEEASHIQVSMLMDNGVDMHSFQPSVKDIVEISSCDLFLYVGGESDSWVKDALGEARNENMVVLNLLESLGEKAKEEERVEGMQEATGNEDTASSDSTGAYSTENSEASDSTNAHATENLENLDITNAYVTENSENDSEKTESSGEFDEHIWLSLKNAEFFCDKISDALQQLDPEHADRYRKNAEAYKEKLGELDAGYEEAVENASLDTLVFASRFPFRYLVEDYGLQYYAAFSGCEAETEASFDTIIFLAEKADELGVPAILTIDGDDPKIAETVRDNTKEKSQQILVMDSMQSTTSEDLKNGNTYLSIMEKNLGILIAALG